MSLRYDNRTVTNDGNDLLAYSLSQKKSVVVDATVVSQQTVQAGTELEELTINDFGNYIQFPANNIKYKKNTFIPGATITNHNILATDKNSQYLSNIAVPKDIDGNPIKDSNGKPVTYQLGDLTADFMINMVGTIAHTEGENNQVLLNVAIANPNKAWKIPEYSEDIPYNNNFDFPIAYSHAANVIIDVSNAGYVTQEDLKDAMKHVVSIDEDGNVVQVTNFTNSLKYKGSEVATKLDTGDAYNRALSDSENYAKLLSLQPSGDLHAGDNLDNYKGKFVVLNVFNINMYREFGCIGMPDQVIFGKFIALPDSSYTQMFITDNMGNIWQITNGVTRLSPLWFNIVTNTAIINEGNFEINSLYRSGTYIFGNDVYLAQQPIDIRGVRIVNVTATGLMTDIHQEFIANNDPLGYRRMLTSIGWQDWKKLGS